MKEKKNEWKKDWINERKIEWMKERLNEWKNEWMNDSWWLWMTIGYSWCSFVNDLLMFWGFGH